MMRWLIYSHIWLAVVASALTASVFYALHLTFEWAYLFMMFTGVMAVYNTHSLISYAKGLVHPQLKIFIKYRKNNLLFITVLASITSSMFLYHYIHTGFLSYIILPALSVFLYEWFTIRTVDSKLWLWVKPFLLTISWLYYTVVVPQLITESYHLGFTFVAFVFIFSIVMLFELRDSYTLDSSKAKGWADFLGKTLWVNVYYLAIIIVFLSSLWNAKSIYQYIWIIFISISLFLMLRTRHVFTYHQTMFNWDGSLLLLATYFILHHA